MPLVDAELDRRFPGRALRGVSDPDGLREAWHALEEEWEHHRNAVRDLDALAARA